MTVFCGIDPGASTGGISFMMPNGNITAALPVIRDDGQAEILDGNSLARLIVQMQPTVAVLEAAQSFPGQGVVSVFRYGQAYGTIIGVLEACAVPIYKVAPAKWKRDLGLQSPPKGLNSSKKTTWRKKESLRVATELFPEEADQWRLVKDNHRAEALLIAHWGKCNHVHL